MSKRIFIVSKVSAVDRLPPADIANLERIGVVDSSVLEHSRAAHLATIAKVKKITANYDVVESTIYDIDRRAMQQCDLVIAVGGDGTVLSVHNHLADTPLLAVNSDPSRSVGHYTVCQEESVCDLIRLWEQGRHHIKSVPRLRLRIGTHTVNTVRQWRILNDCLFSNKIPSAMTRYQLQTPYGTEIQAGSGIWISSLSGASGAIASAGFNGNSYDNAALLFKVREPFCGHGEPHLIEGGLSSAEQLCLRPTIPGIGCYLDGSFAHHDVPPGYTASFDTHTEALQCVSFP